MILLLASSLPILTVKLLPTACKPAIPLIEFESPSDYYREEFSAL